MADDLNPYQPPGSSLQGQVAQAPALWAQSMRTSANFAIGTGLVLLAAAIAAPYILTWQIENLLREYGAEHHIKTMVAAHVDTLRNAFLMQGVLSLAAVVAGGFARRLHLRALVVLLLVVGLLAVNAAWGIVEGPDSARAFSILRALWLGFVLHYLWKTYRLRPRPLP